MIWAAGTKEMEGARSRERAHGKSSHHVISLNTGRGSGWSHCPVSGRIPYQHPNLRGTSLILNVVD